MGRGSTGTFYPSIHPSIYPPIHPSIHPCSSKKEVWHFWNRFTPFCTNPNFNILSGDCPNYTMSEPCKFASLDGHSDMSHTMTVSWKHHSGHLGGEGDAMVSRGNAGLTTSKSGHSCPCQNCSQGTPAEKIGRWSLLNRPLCPPSDSIDQGTELNWTMDITIHIYYIS